MQTNNKMIIIGVCGQHYRGVCVWNRITMGWGDKYLFTKKLTSTIAATVLNLYILEERVTVDFEKLDTEKSKK